METRTYKNLIIGFGKAGKTLAKFLSGQGETVALIEASSDMYGGTCINVGCIPSKSLIVNSQKNTGYAEAFAKKTTLIGKLNPKNYHMVADLENAEVIDGKARFLSDHLVELVGKDLQIRADRIFINTGAQAILPNIKGLDDSQNVLTSTEALQLETLPKELVIVGSGSIGLEFAQMFTNYGSKVTVLSHATRILKTMDEDVSAQVQSDMEKAGITFELGVEPVELTDKEGQTEVTFVSADGNRSVLKSDKILFAIGRKPNTSDLGLEHTTVEQDEKGAILVNEKLETSAKNIWALGDVHGGPQFTYASLDDFRIVKDQLFGSQTKNLNNRSQMPQSLFIQPALSTIGKTQAQLKAEGISPRVFKLASTSIPKSAILGQAKGFFKAMVSAETDQILGAVIYAEESYEVINLLALAMQAQLPYTVLRDQIFTHPTMSEALNDLFAAENEVTL
ncbi:MAG: FAD-dependent oxidoreductase [Lactococcus sp.]